MTTETLSNFLNRNNMGGIHAGTFAREKVALPTSNGKRVYISRARAWIAYREAGMDEVRALKNILPAFVRVAS